MIRFGTKTAAIGGAVGLLLAAGSAMAIPGVQNPGFESPTDTTDSTSATASGWTLDPAVGDDYTNPGQRCTFAANSGTWSFWLQTFVKQGDANQVPITTVTPGTLYNFTMQMAFEVPGYNNVTLANQASDPNQTNTGDLYSYLEIQFENSSGNAVGLPDITTIPAGTVTTANHVFSPYSVVGLAPAGATQALIQVGWNNGGADGNTGGQSAFADDATFSSVVPEPTSLGLLGLGGLATLARRRKA